MKPLGGAGGVLCERAGASGSDVFSAFLRQSAPADFLSLRN